jgi:hypothetical protein
MPPARVCCSLPARLQELKEKGNYEQRRKAVEAFNASHAWRKRGLCLMPCTYHLTVSARSAIVHVFRDGSVTIIAPGSEMGQGLQVKVLQTAAYELSKVSTPDPTSQGSSMTHLWSLSILKALELFTGSVRPHCRPCPRTVRRISPCPCSRWLRTAPSRSHTTASQEAPPPVSRCEAGHRPAAQLAAYSWVLTCCFYPQHLRCLYCPVPPGV